LASIWDSAEDHGDPRLEHPQLSDHHLLGWLCVLGVIPYVNFVLYIWLVCVVPGAHGRTKWWKLPFLIPFANVIAFWVYAFTLQPVEREATAGLDPTIG
jgi:hypothetical protein